MKNNKCFNEKNNNSVIMPINGYKLLFWSSTHTHAHGLYTRTYTSGLYTPIYTHGLYTLVHVHAVCIHRTYIHGLYTHTYTHSLYTLAQNLLDDILVLFIII